MKNEIIYMDLLNVRVCSEGTWDEALEWLRSTNPAGTSNNWEKKTEPKEALPVACVNGKGRTHYTFIC